jgi:hypothetical protein
MADTGAPWNIPYAEPSDLVRDWPALSEDVADAVADALDTRKFGQIVQTVKTDQFSSTTAGFQTVTGLSVTITPSTNTSRVLLVANINGSHSQTSGAHVAFRITGGNAGNFVADADGARTRVATGQRWSDVFSGVTQGWTEEFSIIYLDSPASAAAVTYNVEVSRNAGTVYVNRTQDATDAADRIVMASSLTAIEVAA